MRVVADTGPLVAAANARDRAHALAKTLVTELGSELIVLSPVAADNAATVALAFLEAWAKV